MYYILSSLLIPNDSRVLPLSMRYASLAFRTLSLLDLMRSSGISVMSLAERLLVRKCSETVVGCQLISVVFVETGSLSRRLVSPMYCLEQWFHCVM